MANAMLESFHGFSLVVPAFKVRVFTSEFKF